jgi:hypothetical protein
MSLDFSTLSLNQLLWLIIIVVGLVVAFIVVRFFFHHILKHLIQGCLVVLAILAVLAILHYFGVF